MTYFLDRHLEMNAIHEKQANVPTEKLLYLIFSHYGGSQKTNLEFKEITGQMTTILEQLKSSFKKKRHPDKNSSFSKQVMVMWPNCINSLNKAYNFVT